MKYSQAIVAYNALYNLVGVALPVKEAYEIYKLTNSLRDEYNYFANREKEILEKYEGRIMPDGSIDFNKGDDEELLQKSQENINGFIHEMNELRNMEINIEVTPIKIDFDMLGDYKISPNDIRALEGFVEFE